MKEDITLLLQLLLLLLPQSLLLPHTINTNSSEIYKVICSKLSVWISPPFIDYTTNHEEGGDEGGGMKEEEGSGGIILPKDSMDVRILKEASKMLNFSYILREPSDGLWGYLLDNGSWTGTVGTVQRGEADFSLMLSITWERTYAVQFTRAYYVEPMTFVVRKPGPLPQWQAPIKPFSWKVWIAVLISVVMSGPILWLVLHLTPHNYNHNHNYNRPQPTNNTTVANNKEEYVKEEQEKSEGEKSEGRQLSFGTMVLYMTAPIFSEPVPLFPRSSSGRVLCGLWWVFCILTTTLYRGSLISRLTIPSLSPTLNTLEQLASSSSSDHYEWGMLDTYGSGYQLFRASKVPVYQALFQDMQYHNTDHSMHLVLNGNYAFISWKTYFRNLIARDYTDRNGITKVHMARVDFFPGGFGWAFPPGSPYLPTLDAFFLRLIEAGIIDQWMSDLIRLSALLQRPRQEVEEDVVMEAAEDTMTTNTPQPFTVFHLQGIFFIILGGFVLAALTFLTEITVGTRPM
ncbi:hypothetical protein Pcinc_007630 [Petrolisthes cinctipes]|uniref:Uncharacterized protein n=1 Tax=Petrolisthes cinctipes TaxID=88211 RepID=A0AAE1GAQ4_PETCI|nr:hypothetical protein Pcinc_007630 [Petrolisthes cinctipes]